MDSTGRTFANAVVGAVASFVLALVPFSVVLGGAVAGWLQRGYPRDGATAGTVAGLLAFPVFFLAVAVLAPLFLFAPAGVPSIPGSQLGFVVLGFLGTVIYAVGGAALGGAVGAYLAAVHHDDSVDPADADDATGPITSSSATASPSED